jgi:hypothetical protein
MAVRDAIESIDDRACSPLSGEDLTARARGCRAIVYVPEPRLLDATAEPSSNVDRVRAVIQAARAPSVERVVVIEPSSCAWIEGERVLAESRVTHTIVRSAALVDELADATNLHTACSLWVARGRDLELTCRATLARAIRSALVFGEVRGLSIVVASERVAVAEAVRRAAAVAGASTTKVYDVAPRVSAAVRKVRSWLGRTPLEVDKVCDRLGRAVRGTRVMPA